MSVARARVVGVVLFASGVAGAVACAEAVRDAPSSPDAPALAPSLAEPEGETRAPYVLGLDRTLWSLHPEQRAFERKGTIPCVGYEGSPSSMAIDRRGVAWIHYSNDSIWKLRIKTFTCERTSFAAPSVDFVTLGMGFSSDVTGESTESLFVSGRSGAIGRVDAQTAKLSILSGRGMGQRAELTGTGDGKLYAFATTTPATIAETDKRTGEALAPRPRQGVATQAAWAVSFHGGDFYVYTAAGIDGGAASPRPEETIGPSTVTRFRPIDGSADVVVETRGSPSSVRASRLVLRPNASADATDSCAGGHR